MEPKEKKRRYNIQPKKQLIFNDTYDDDQLKKWFDKINEILMQHIDVKEIIYNIAIFSTGSIAKCTGSLGNNCNGSIHFLKSDNFNDKRDVCTHTCDNNNCGIDWNAFICDADDCDEKWICEKNTTLKGVCMFALKSECKFKSTFCDKHRQDEDWALECIVCSNCCCIPCSFKDGFGKKCLSCKDYYCDEHYIDDAEYFFCEKCISALSYECEDSHI